MLACARRNQQTTVGHLIRTYPRKQSPTVVEAVVLVDDERREEDAPGDNDDAAGGVDAVKVLRGLVDLDAPGQQLHAGESLMIARKTPTNEAEKHEGRVVRQSIRGGKGEGRG